MTNYIIFGASRGIGAMFALELPQANDQVWIVSRSAPNDLPVTEAKRIWVQADLSSPNAAQTVAAAVADHTIDVLIYNAGIWEEHAFSERYDFEQVPDEETARIMTINLTSAITCIHRLLPALRRSQNAKIILIGSTSGIDNAGSPEVAYAASKFGLRGVAHALRETLRGQGIATTVLNLGNVGTLTYENGVMSFEPVEDGMVMVSLSDLVATLRYLINLSGDSLVKEMTLSASTDDV